MAAVASEVRARLSDPQSSALFSRQHLVSTHTRLDLEARLQRLLGFACSCSSVCR